VVRVDNILKENNMYFSIKDTKSDLKGVKKNKFYDIVSGIHKGKIGMLLEYDKNSNVCTFLTVRDEMFECGKSDIKLKTIFG